MIEKINFNELKDVNIFETREIFEYITSQIDKYECIDEGTIESDAMFLYKAVHTQNDAELDQLRQSSWLSETDNKEELLKMLDTISANRGKSISVILDSNFKPKGISADSSDRWNEQSSSSKTTIDTAIQFIKDNKSEINDERSVDLYNLSREYELERLVKMYESR
jgi:hypothetical protein